MDDFFPLYISLEILDEFGVPTGKGWITGDDSLVHCQIGDYIKNPNIECNPEDEPGLEGEWMVQERQWSHWNNFRSHKLAQEAGEPWHRNLTIFITRRR